jgi:predicted TIM-barrel fold metal-dependent hydrolase
VLTDDDLPRLWHDLGVPGVFDVHTHFLPQAVLRKVWAYFDAAERSYGIAWPITYRWDDEQRLDHLRAMGVRRFTALVYAHKPGMADWLSRWALDFASRAPDCLPTATFYPEAGAAAYVADSLRAGARIYKLHLQVGEFDPRDPLLDEVWGLLSDAGVPVLIHCGSAPLPGRFTGPGPISEVLHRFPRLPVIIAHLGANEYDDFLTLTARRELTWLDTTMALTDFMQAMRPFPEASMPALRELATGGKILLGSDFPNIPYPYAHQIEVLMDAGLDLRQVVWDAPSALFG